MSVVEPPPASAGSGAPVVGPERPVRGVPVVGPGRSSGPGRPVRGRR